MKLKVGDRCFIWFSAHICEGRICKFFDDGNIEVQSTMSNSIVRAEHIFETKIECLKHDLRKHQNNKRYLKLLLINNKDAVIKMRLENIK